MKMPTLKVITRAIALFGAGLATAVLLANQLWAPDNDKLSMTKWGNAPKFTTEWLDEAAQNDYVFLTPGVWEFTSANNAQKELVRRNVDIKFGMYFNIHTTALWMARADTSRYPRKLFDHLIQYTVYTPNGTPASFWKDNPVYDMRNPECRAGAIDILADFVETNKVDAIFLDYASYITKNYMPIDGREWEPDFDGDGIGYLSDENEQLEVVQAYKDYILELRAALPQGTELIVNGNLAIFNDEFAATVDGVFLEDFPQFFWGPGTAPNWENALDPEYPSSLPQLVERGPEVFLGDRWGNQRVKDTAEEFDVFYTEVRP